jgi:hypothetical protein
MDVNLYCTEITNRDLDGYGFNVGSRVFEYKVSVRDSMITLSDSLGRFVPFDITELDQIIDALETARTAFDLPGDPDTYVEPCLGC